MGRPTAAHRRRQRQNIWSTSGATTSRRALFPRSVPSDAADGAFGPSRGCGRVLDWGAPGEGATPMTSAGLTADLTAGAGSRPRPSSAPSTGRPGPTCTCRSARGSARSARTTRCWPRRSGARYFAALRREVDGYLPPAATGRAAFTSLYVGGGTPTLYPDELAELIERIPVSRGACGRGAAHPRGCADREQARSIGFTAVSVGAQSFHDDVLRRLGRPHDAATSLAAVRAAVGRFDCVDVDLIVDAASGGRAGVPRRRADLPRTSASTRCRRTR